MTLIQVLVVLAVVAAVGAVAAGVVRGELAEPSSTLPDAELPPAPLRGSDLAQVRFSLALRGYRMSQVDEALDRAGAELDARDLQIQRLRAQLDQQPAPLDQQPAPLEQQPAPFGDVGRDG